MDLYLLRHGHVNRQEEDPGLTEIGIAQAQRAAAWIGEHLPIQAVYSSDLRRAAETAQLIQAQTGIPATLEARLREYKGWSAHYVPRANPDTEPESWHLFWLRVITLLSEMLLQHDKAAVLWVTHGGLFDLLSAQALHLGRGQNMVTMTHHTGLSRYQVGMEGGKPAVKVEFHNDTSHLPPDLQTY